MEVVTLWSSRMVVGARGPTGRVRSWSGAGPFSVPSRCPRTLAGTASVRQTTSGMIEITQRDMEYPNLHRALISVICVSLLRILSGQYSSKVALILKTNYEWIMRDLNKNIWWILFLHFLIFSLINILLQISAFSLSSLIYYYSHKYHQCYYHSYHNRSSQSICPPPLALAENRGVVWPGKGTRYLADTTLAKEPSLQVMVDLVGLFRIVQFLAQVTDWISLRERKRAWDRYW